MKKLAILAILASLSIMSVNASATPTATGGLDLTYYNDIGASNQRNMVHAGVKWKKGPYVVKTEVGYMGSLSHSDMVVGVVSVNRGPATLTVVGGKQDEHKYLSAEARYKRLAVTGSKETGNVNFGAVLGDVNTQVTTLGARAYVFSNKHVDVHAGVVRVNATNQYGSASETVPTLGVSLKF